MKASSAEGPFVHEETRPVWRISWRVPPDRGSTVARIRLGHLPRSSGSGEAANATDAGRGHSMIRNRSTWTIERVARMKTLIDAGLSCAQIADEIGVSRNAVIGKANRLHLSRFTTATQGQAERTGPPQIARMRIARGRRLPALQANPPTFVEMSANPASRRSLSELREWHCRWPIGDPGTEDFGFCGNKPLDGLPYCSMHARLAYRRPPKALSGFRRTHR